VSSLIPDAEMSEDNNVSLNRDQIVRLDHVASFIVNADHGIM
jgi:hypothetical protein